VEVIVVLVILAILAAIAIPALTGYIEKAKWEEKIMQARTQMIAIQTMIDLQYAKDGGFAAHDYVADPSAAPSGELWVGIGVSDVLYIFNQLTQDGLASYVELTGDTQSFGVGNLNDGKHGRPIVRTDRAGAIKVYQYAVNHYFTVSPLSRPPGGRGHLEVWFIENRDSTDAVTLGFLADAATADPDWPDMLTSGFNVFHRSIDSHKYTKLR
jgi:type II secretory pathway pseudopilin PulG